MKNLNYRSKAQREVDTNILKTALINLIIAKEKGNKEYLEGLWEGINVERIREVLHNLPEVDASYLNSKRIVESAAEIIRKEKIPHKI